MDSKVSFEWWFYFNFKAAVPPFKINNKSPHFKNWQDALHEDFQILNLYQNGSYVLKLLLDSAKSPCKFMLYAGRTRMPDTFLSEVTYIRHLVIGEDLPSAISSMQIHLDYSAVEGLTGFPFIMIKLDDT